LLFGKKSLENIIRQILVSLKKLVGNKKTLKKYVNQLMMLSRLRKIEGLTVKIAEEMPIHIDVETDTLYIRGTEKGIEKGVAKSVVKLWQKGIEPTMISNLLDLTLEQVEHIIADWQKQNVKVK
jgi:hypothetical protein